jgi:hypothetical protein
MAKRRKPSVGEPTPPEFCVMPTQGPHLASMLLFGEQTTSKDGWTTQRKFPKLGSEQEIAARAALADELRAEAPWGHFVGLVAAMIDPRTRGALSRPQIKFSGHRGKNSKPQTTERRAAQIAAYIHETRTDHKSLEDAIASAAAHFGFVESVIWEAWNAFKPDDKYKPKPGSMWDEYKPKR